MDFDSYMDNTSSYLRDVSSEILTKFTSLKEKKDAIPAHFEAQYFKILSNLQGKISEWLELSNSCLELIDAACTIREQKRVMKWHPERTDMLEVNYLSGYSPWSLWFSFNKLDEVEKLMESVRDNWKRNELEKITVAEKGMDVIVRDNDHFFRGIILHLKTDENTSLVLNIDTGGVKWLSLERMYYLTPDLYGLHANAIQCQLLEGSEEAWWSAGVFVGPFIKILAENRLTINITGEVESVPPKFIVELFAFKEGSEVEVSINEWLINSLVPVIEKIGKNNMVCAAYFDQPDLDPFSKSKQNSSEGIVLGQSVLHKDCAVVLHKDNAVALKTKNSEKEYYANRNRLAHLLATNDNKKSSPSRTVDNSPINSEPCSKTFELTSIKPTKEGRSQKRIFQFESVINVPEFRPENRVIRNDTLDSSLVSMEGGMSELSLIPGLYTPTDDERICTCYASRGYCWKKNCRKEHPVSYNPEKWTNNTEDIYNDTAHQIVLPDVGSEETVTVTHVQSSNSFFVHLPPRYSDKEGESLELLLSSLNSVNILKQMSLLTNPPSLGEHLVALSNLKGQWLRASVYDVIDSHKIVACFVDYGFTEEVTFDKCRTILPQFIHLPHQAVYCTLHKLFVNSKNEMEGKAFLETIILNKKVDIVVKNSESTDCVEVIAYLNCINVNDMMVRKGFCLKSLA